MEFINNIIKNNWKMAFIAIMLFFVVLFGSKLMNRNNRLIIYKDSLRVLTNKAGELYSKVNYYQITEKELKRVNGELYLEVNKIKDKPLSIETVTTNTSINNIPLQKGALDTVFSKGNTISLLVKDDTLKRLKIETKLYLSQTIRNGQLSLNARSDFPGLTFTNIEGYNLNALPSKPKRFGIGVQAGINYNGRITLGIGISYNLIRF